MLIAELLADLICALLVATVAATVGTRMLPVLARLGRGPVFAAAAICSMLVGIVATPTGLPLGDAALLFLGGFVGLALARAYVGTVGSRAAATGPDPEQNGPATTRAAGLAVSGYLWVLVALLLLTLVRWVFALNAASLT